MSYVIVKISPSFSFNSTSTQLKPNSTQSIPTSTAPQLNSTPTQFKLSFNLISNLIQPQLNLNLIQLNPSFICLPYTHPSVHHLFVYSPPTHSSIIYLPTVHLTHPSILYLFTVHPPTRPSFICLPSIYPSVHHPFAYRPPTI